MTTFYQVTVSEIRRETRDAVVVSLAIPDEHKHAFRFTQGQYITFRAIIDGEEVRRSYSICAGADDGVCRVAIKKAPDGRFSIWANEAIRPGQQLEAMPPMGNFYVPLDPANRKHYVGFAAGSGITPLLSIIKTTLAREPHSRFSLFYGNRASSTIMFREELEDLKNEHLSALSIAHILSREHQELDLFNGRIGRDKCRQLFEHWLDVGTVDTAFICGPQEMMLEVSESPPGAWSRPATHQIRAVRHHRYRAAPPRAAQRRRRQGRSLPGDGEAGRARAAVRVRKEHALDPGRRAARGAWKRPSPARPASARPAAPCWSKGRPTWTPTMRSRITRSPAATS